MYSEYGFFGDSAKNTLIATCLGENNVRAMKSTEFALKLITKLSICYKFVMILKNSLIARRSSSYKRPKNVKNGHAYKHTVLFQSSRYGCGKLLSQLYIEHMKNHNFSYIFENNWYVRLILTRIGYLNFNYVTSSFDSVVTDISKYN